MSALSEYDPEIYSAVIGETRRESSQLELIASENFVSEAVLEALGCVMTNKYAEGYPGRRYYGGCEFVDQAETLARDRAKELFGCDHVNVQPHSGSQANMAAYLTVLKPGDRILGLNLSHGGHLTHGHPLNFSGFLFDVYDYGVDPESETIDYDVLIARARDVKPKMLVAGASAYPRKLDFERMREAADACGAYLMVDIAHIAGLVIAGLHPSPVAVADFVTTTTHKTLRGPRGGMVMCKAEYKKALDRMVMPGIQGGPLMHVIAAKAVAFKEALEPQFNDYQRCVVKNAQAMAQRLKSHGHHIISGGTDTHLVLVSFVGTGITGKQIESSLERAGITVNKNAVPFDPEKPLVTSGIRIGTPAVTTRGMDETAMLLIADLIDRVIQKPGDESVETSVAHEVKSLCERFPLYESRLATLKQKTVAAVS